MNLSWATTWPTTTGSVSSPQSSASCVAQLCAAMLRLQASGHAHVCRNSKNKTDALDKYSFLTFLTVTLPCSILPSCRQARSSQSAPQPLTGKVDASWIQRAQLAVNDLINLPAEVLVLCPQGPPKQSFVKFPARSAVANNWRACARWRNIDSQTLVIVTRMFVPVDVCVACAEECARLSFEIESSGTFAMRDFGSAQMTHQCERLQFG